MQPESRRRRRDAQQAPSAEQLAAGQRYTQTCVRAQDQSDERLRALYETLLERVPFQVRHGDTTYEPETLAQADVLYRAVYGAPTLDQVCAMLSRHYDQHADELPRRDYFAAENMPRDVLGTIVARMNAPSTIRGVSRGMRAQYERDPRVRDARLLSDTLLALLQRAANLPGDASLMPDIYYWQIDVPAEPIHANRSSTVDSLLLYALPGRPDVYFLSSMGRSRVFQGLPERLVRQQLGDEGMYAFVHSGALLPAADTRRLLGALLAAPGAHLMYSPMLYNALRQSLASLPDAQQLPALREFLFAGGPASLSLAHWHASIAAQPGLRAEAVSV